MAFDFPASPAEGAVYTQGQYSYTFTNGVWVTTGIGGMTQAQADARYVDVTGDTMTGDLIFDYPAYEAVRFKRGGKHRWSFGVNDEAGGAFFSVSRYNDAGTWLEDPIQISRTTGIVTATGLAPKPTPTGSAGIGEWRYLNGATNTQLFLPAGGTWAFVCTYMNTTSGALAGAWSSGAVAGGTYIQAPNATLGHTGFCWRIA